MTQCCRTTRTSGDRYHAVGDPTEGALVLAAACTGILKPDLDRAFPRIAEVPFDSVRKRMTTLHRTPQSNADVPPSLQPFWERKDTGGSSLHRIHQRRHRRSSVHFEPCLG